MIIGISIPSFIAVMGSVLTYEYMNNVKDRQGLVQIADDLKEHVLEVRRNEKNFLHFKNDEQFNNLHNTILTLTASINSISRKTVKEMGEEDFSLFSESAQTYSIFVDDLYKNYNQETEVVEKVRIEGRRLESFAVTENNTKGLSTSFILHLRLQEKNYMLFRDKKSLIKLKIALSQIKKITPFCNECLPYIESLNNLFSIYKKIDKTVDELQVTGSKLEGITDRIAIRERQRISSFITLAQRLLLIVFALLGILGPLFIYKTATYIAAPIKRLADITKKISEGEITLRAPLKEHDETFSLALSFNTMLDHLQLTQESLAKSLELLYEKQAQLVESEKRASIGFLVSGVAHELNNPLNNISLTAETMKEGQKELTQEELTEYIQDIFVEVERAQHVVENLLDFAGARRSTVMEKQDIVSVVKKSTSLVANQLRMQNINLQLDVPGTIFFVKGNKSKLEQIFINIILNAIQSMKDKGTLTINARPGAEGENILIKITDTGHGIPENDIKNIFEPFFTTKPLGEGTGLGLSVSQSLAIEHNGKIEVESKVGIGTTFTVILPLYKAGD